MRLYNYKNISKVKTNVVLDIVDNLLLNAFPFQFNKIIIL